MFYSLIILVYYHHSLLLHATSASSLLFTINNVRYSLSDRVLTIPKLGALRGVHIDYENEYNKKYNLVNIDAVSAIVSDPDTKGSAIIMAYPSTITLLCPLSVEEIKDIIYQVVRTPVSLN